MFKWPVLSQDEILDKQRPLEPGNYKFRVENAEFGMSNKTSKPQIALTLTIFGPNGKEPTCFDYLVATPEMAWKTKKFWQSVGHPEKYETGECSENDFLGKRGFAKIKLVKSDDGEKQYVKIAEYLPQETKTEIQNFDPNGIELNDDDIPKDLPF